MIDLVFFFKGSFLDGFKVFFFRWIFDGFPCFFFKLGFSKVFWCFSWGFVGFCYFCWGVLVVLTRHAKSYL